MHEPTGIREELQQFEDLKALLEAQARHVFPDRLAPRTVIVVPSLSLDPDVLATVSGAQHYEERMLCLLMLLRLPRTKVVYVTSVPIDPTIIDYHLHLLPGVPTKHARRRLSLLSAHDASNETLVRKVLARPRLVQRIREEILDPDTAHLTVFNATEEERSLAVQLGVPLYATDPRLLDVGSKSGGREVFEAAGIPHPDGFSRLHHEDEMASSLAELKRRDPELKRCVVKLEQGASGLGNAVFDFQGAPEGERLLRWIRDELPTRLRYEADDQTWDTFRKRFRTSGGIVECWVSGSDKQSPSVQCRIDPLGTIEVISTHDQVLGGNSGQTFLGSRFPASEEYRLEIQEAGRRIAEVLRERNVIGRFGVDFVSVREAEGWKHYAIEINIRKGGTTHPFMTLQFLTNGHYDEETGLFRVPTGPARFYYSSDNLKNPDFRRLRPDDLIDIALEQELHFDGATQQGVVFHLIGAMSEYGKLGVVCVADSIEAAERMYAHTVDVLNREALA